MKSWLLLFLSTLIFLPAQSWAQSPFFNKYELDENFANTNITLLYEDHNTIIWVGTTDGLFRFNGKKFQHFPSPDSAALEVSAIFLDQQEQLWVGFQDGSIAQMGRQKLKPWIPANDKFSSAISGIAQDQHGRIWLATYGEGLYLYQEGNWLHFSIENGLLSDNIYQMRMGESDKIHLATDGGINICQFVNGKLDVKNLSTAEGLKDEIVKDLMLDSGGNMVFGTFDQGIGFYDLEKNSFSLTNNSCSSAKSSSICCCSI